MRRQIMPITMIALFSVGALACDKPGVTEQQKETTALEQAKSAADEAQRQAQGAQAAANMSISAARAEFETTRENYVHRRRLDLIALDKRIADLEASSRTEANAKSGAQKGFQEIDAQREAFVRHMLTVETTTSEAWDSAVASLDKEWDALKNTVDDSR